MAAMGSHLGRVMSSEDTCVDKIRTYYCLAIHVKCTMRFCSNGEITFKRQAKKEHAFSSQYGEVRKVDPPAVGPRDSVL